ncbi:VWA domain-containing protein [uncultured Paraglaciecola sp.]|jgi:Ca-activated chloride channel family protein|uniref:vWA domain-containing protein n=1 Tax=uncultured Paraglaciecola sp. TaxID=1765024 RepID=UPI002634CC56|nr:VWA domain-containing protein [uncultured Paraglaciecola sp.]
MKNFKNHSNKTSNFNMYIVSTTLLILTVACSSGTKENKTAEELKKHPKPVVAVSRTIEMHLIRESMADKEILFNSFAHKSQQQRFRPDKPVIVNTENYQHYTENGIKSVLQDPVSTFSIDVDTGSYSNIRRMINQGMLPPSDAIRIEEFINYFDYDYPQQSENGSGTDAPFSINAAIATSPWAEQRHIMRIALKGFTPDVSQITGRNLVFLLDVSGSMNQPNKLPLLTRSLELLTGQLSEQDSVSIVVYAGASGVVLEPTQGNNKARIKQALSSLSAGGSTNGQAGIELAYSMAEQAFIKGGVNRVILATDGDFNVGVINHQRLIELIKHKRQKGIALTTLGFGQGNYNDHLMEQLADAGNGNYAYIDNIHEARKVLVDEMNATLLTIAKDVKIQVEFNLDLVAEYRLLGYENRALKREDFNNDKVDAGEIGAGHTVTALYELILKTSNNTYLEPLRYQQVQIKNDPNLQINQFSDELALVKLRYKPVNSEKSQLITQAVMANQITEFKQQSDDFRFATSVVGFAHLLKQSHFWQDMSYQQIIELAQGAKGKDEFGYRAEFINLVRSSASLQVSISNQPDENLQLVELNLQGFAGNIKVKPTLLNVH